MGLRGMLSETHCWRRIKPVGGLWSAVSGSWGMAFPRWCDGCGSGVWWLEVVEKEVQAVGVVVICGR